jgi:hypothetical protein
MRRVIAVSLPSDRQRRLQSSLCFLDHDVIIDIRYCHERPPIRCYGLEVFTFFLSIFPVFRMSP